MAQQPKQVRGEVPFRSGRALTIWVLACAIGNAVFALTWAFVYAMSVIGFSAAELRLLALYVVLAATAALALAATLIVRHTAPLARVVDAWHAGPEPDANASARDAHEGFGALMRLPGFLFALGMSLWTIGGVVFALVLHAVVPNSSAFDMLVVVVAATSGGLASQCIVFVWTKTRLTPIRERLAAEIPDPDEREALVPHTPIARKLLVALTGLILADLAFGLFLAQARTQRRADREWQRAQAELLDRLAHADRTGTDPHRWIDRTNAVLPSSAFRLALIDPNAASRTSPEGLTVSDLARIRRHPSAGSSLESSSGVRFMWRRLPGGRWIAVVVTPRSNTATTLAAMAGDYGVLFVFSAGITILLVLVGVRDVTRAGDVLTREVNRVAEGDLSSGHVFESEDEFGALARSFSRMASSLRTTVGRVVGTASRVEEASTKIRDASTSVASVTEEQVAGIREAASALESMYRRTDSLAEPTAALDGSMAHSADSLRQIAEASGQLDESSTRLSSQASEVAALTAQLIENIRKVAAHTDSLQASTLDATASVEEMASSVRQISENATESAKLAERVVGSAEQGRTRVQETTRGMRAILASTEGVEKVIHGLVEAAERIGGILGVINGVADETHLLALNAAIIAAQAGEHGRSFGVVADQVKQLAERVRTSTREIETVIETVQGQAQEAASAIDESAVSVRRGVELSSDASDSLEAITQTARESGARISEIEAGIREHSRAAAHAATLVDRLAREVEAIRQAGVEQLDGSGVVQRNTTSMEEIARTVRQAAEGQARSVAMIRETVVRARETMARLHEAFAEHREACAVAAKLMLRIHERTAVNERSVAEMDQATESLGHEAEELRAEVRRFRL